MYRPCDLTSRWTRHPPAARPEPRECGCVACVLVPDAHRYTIVVPGGKGGGVLTVGALYDRRSAWEEYER